MDRNTYVTVYGFVCDWPEGKGDALIGFTVSAKIGPDLGGLTSAIRIPKQAIAGSREELSRIEFLEAENARMKAAVHKAEAALEEVLRRLPKPEEAAATVSILEDAIWWFKGFSASAGRRARLNVPDDASLRAAMGVARRVKDLAEKTR